MHWQKRRYLFRQQLSSNLCVHPASVYDPISARIAESLGYEVGMFAGSVASLTVLGDPDLILLTLSEFAAQTYRINRACELPLMVDADHGYGNALNVKRTVEELETAGVCGLSIEDTELPRSFSTGGKTQLISIAEGVGKMRAAVAGRQDPDLIIAARTSALLVNNMSDTLTRIRAYQDTGVDAIFLIGVKQLDQLEEIAAVCQLPLILGGASTELGGLDTLGDLGVRISLQGHAPVMAAIQATYSAMSALRDGVSPGDLQSLPEKDMIRKMCRQVEFDSWSQEFLE